MSPAVIVALILVVGIALVIAATLADRRNALRAAAEQQGQSVDDTGVRPALDAPTGSPAYITTDQLLDQAPPAARFSPDEERALAAQLAASSTTKVACRLAAPTLATHTGARAILDQPAVLVCADTINQFRELTALLAAASADRVPIVIAAPTIDAETLQTVIANKLGGTVAVAVVLGGDQALTELAAAAGSPVHTLADRQSGAAGLRGLGRPTRVLADPDATWVIA